MRGTRTKAGVPRYREDLDTAGQHRQEHGRTASAWTTVFVLIAGSIVCGFAVVFAVPWLFGLGLGIGVLGIVIGKAMSMAGYGGLPSVNDQVPEGTRAEGPARTERQRDLDTFTDVG